MRFDIEYLNPKNNPGTLYAIKCENEEEAALLAPILITASSQWKPEDIKIISVKKSIYAEQIED